MSKLRCPFSHSINAGYSDKVGWCGARQGIRWGRAGWGWGGGGGGGRERRRQFVRTQLASNANAKRKQDKFYEVDD